MWVPQYMAWFAKLNLHLRPNLPPPGAAATPQAALEWVCARALADIVARGTLPPPGGPPATYTGFLEVCSAVEISRPRPQAGAAAAPAIGARRCLKLGLTDGVRAAVGLETAPLPDLQPPFEGAKLLVNDVEVRHGVLLLAGASCVRVVRGGLAPAAAAAPPARGAASAAAAAAPADEVVEFSDSDEGQVVEVVDEAEMEGGVPSADLLPFLASAPLAAPGSTVLLRDARVVALKGFSAAGGVFSLHALLCAGAGLLRVRALREEAEELLQPADAVQAALLGGGGGGGRAPAAAAWVAVGDAAVGTLLGLSATQFVAVSALPKKDPQRAELKSKLGFLESTLLQQEGGVRVTVVARAPAGAGGAILSLEGCFRMVPG